MNEMGDRLTAEPNLGREAYERDVARRPNYHDGTRRAPWHMLSPIARWSWERPLSTDFPLPAQEER